MQETDVDQATKPTRPKLDLLYALRILIIALIPLTFGVLIYYLVATVYGI